MPNLTLRLTWPGEDRPNDYEVFEDGSPIGRIRLATEMSWKGGEHWEWTLQFYKPGLIGNGLEPSLDEAKAAFKARWDEVRPTLSEADFALHRRMKPSL